MALAAEAMENAETFIDIGSNIGVYTAAMAQALPGKTVFAVEPLEKNGETMTANIEPNGLTNCRPRKGAVSSSRKPLQPYVNPIHDGGGSFIAPAAYRTGDAVFDAKRYREKYPQFINSEAVDTIVLSALLTDMILGLKEPRRGSEKYLNTAAVSGDPSGVSVKSAHRDSRSKIMTSIQCPVCGSNNTRKEPHNPDWDLFFQEIQSLMGCKNCGLVFVSPMPSERDIEKYYREQFSHDNDNANRNDFEEFSCQLAASRIRLMLNHIPLKNKQRCLDIGAGNAIFGKTLKEYAPHIIYDAVEPNDGWRETWGHWVANSFANLSEVEKGAYSLITLNQVLEHIRDPLPFLSQVSECLHSNGFLFVDVPNRDDLYKKSLGPHLLFWDIKSLSSALKRVGMDTVFCESVGMLKVHAERTLGRSSWASKAADPWRWANLVNRGGRAMGIRKRINTFRKFQSDTYGGDRQWIRYIGKKQI